MNHTVKGLVLREVKTGESDRILTLLTGQGIISAVARGAMRPKSKLFSATSLFCYSEFTLFEGRSLYRVNEASVLEVFFGLRNSVQAISAATYFAELVQIMHPSGTEAETLLRLTLNSFYLMAQGKRDICYIKAVYEIRLLTESGFLPDLLACRDCGKYEAAQFYFDARQGFLLCPDCCAKRDIAPNIDNAALAALRHIALVEDSRLFHFTLAPASLLLLAQIAEDYICYSLDYPPKSLAFLKAVME